MNCLFFCLELEICLFIRVKFKREYLTIIGMKNYVFYIVLSILLFNVVKCESFNKNIDIKYSIKVTTASKSKDNWIRKIIGDINSFKKSREEAYLSNVV